MPKLCKVSFICPDCHRECEGAELEKFGPDIERSITSFADHVRRIMLSDVCILCAYDKEMKACRT